MTHRYIKVGITALVLAAAFSGLLWKSLAEGTEFYKHVDEVMATPEQWEGKKLQMHGFVVANSILVRPDTLEYKFKVQSNGKVMDATYKGIVPDTFKDRPGEEAEVVLRGELTPAGFHVAPNGVTAKCPSKYEAAKKVG
ncbi:MAG: cytochrome c maturation protein CcmE [Vicinamibacterales bacterium]